MRDTSLPFDWAVDFYDETRGFPVGEEQAIAALIATVGDLSSQSRVLEMGVGTGRVALPLSHHVKQLVGIDLSRRMMMRLRSKQRQEPIVLVQGDVTRLPFADDSFDAVLAVHVFHLVPQWRQGIAEAARVLKPGGQFMLCGGDPHPLRAQIYEQAGYKQYARAPIGARFNEVSPYIIAQGWDPGPEHQHTYTVIQSPQRIYEQASQRMWSRLYLMDEQQHAEFLAAFRAAIDALFEDPTAEQRLQTSFNVRAFIPPTG